MLGGFTRTDFVQHRSIRHSKKGKWWRRHFEPGSFCYRVWGYKKVSGDSSKFWVVHFVFYKIRNEVFHQVSGFSGAESIARTKFWKEYDDLGIYLTSKHRHPHDLCETLCNFMKTRRFAELDDWSRKGVFFSNSMKLLLKRSDLKAVTKFRQDLQTWGSERDVRMLQWVNGVLRYSPSLVFSSTVRQKELTASLGPADYGSVQGAHGKEWSMAEKYVNIDSMSEMYHQLQGVIVEDTTHPGKLIASTKLLKKFLDLTICRNLVVYDRRRLHSWPGKLFEAHCSGSKGVVIDKPLVLQDSRYFRGDKIGFAL